MYFISLGRNCCVAYNIKKFINNDIPTNFFDWLRTDFKCALNILNLRNIETIFNDKNIIIDKETYKDKQDLGISFKNFLNNDLCLFVPSRYFI
jgi:hypothetical protein